MRGELSSTGRRRRRRRWSLLRMAWACVGDEGSLGRWSRWKCTGDPGTLHVMKNEPES